MFFVVVMILWNGEKEVWGLGFGEGLKSFFIEERLGY